MGFNQRTAILICTLMLLTVSCGGPDVDEGQVNKLRPEVNDNVNINVDPNANVAEDNETELNNLVNLPFDPVENLYREDTQTDPSGNNTPAPARQLTAVLKFSDEDTEKLIEKLTSDGEGFESKIDSEPWFPAELIAKSQTSGDESIKGTGYKADLFYKPPFNSGSLTRVNDTNYFVLIVQAQ